MFWTMAMVFVSTGGSPHHDLLACSFPGMKPPLCSTTAMSWGIFAASASLHHWTRMHGWTAFYLEPVPWTDCARMWNTT